MTERIGIVVNGATGGIADRQHLAQCLVPIIREGGLTIDDRRVVPELLLVGRNEAKLADVAARYRIERWSTDLESALADPDFDIFFDAGYTGLRDGVIRSAIRAGKHVYSEKPVAPDVRTGLEYRALAQEAGIKFGVVEDKLELPGLAKLRQLARTDFFGRITGFRLEFGFWFFSGLDFPDQRGSWNYKKSEGGGLVRDSFPHWRYVIEGILGPIRSVVSRAWTAVADRIDERGRPYVADADDSSVTIIELESGAVGVVQMSTATRVRNDDLINFKIDGTAGSAVGGLHRCYVQPSATTPKVAYDPINDRGVDYRTHWQEVPSNMPPRNGQRVGWEAFLRHVCDGRPIVADLDAGVRDVALAEAVMRSAQERRWVDLAEVGI